ncbi:MAG: glycerol-3-phosphate acyltransferase [Caldisericia bacterium]|nr:glycerol-3-phosphate acyltransferase [Caldisericia bacterium]
MTIPLLFISSYLFGSIPSGYVIGKLFMGVDIQELGNRQIGAANVTRQLGKTFGILCLSFDVLKALIPMSVAYYLFHEPIWVASICGVMAVFGHDFPLFLSFEGGGGMATSMAVLFFIAPLHFFVVAPFALAGTFITRYVSLAGVIQYWAFGVVTWATGAPMAGVYVSLTLVFLGLIKQIPWVVRNPPSKFMKSGFIASDSDPVTSVESYRVD